ncbi:glycosyltransferase family 4 protein [Jannaschia formosa]|uniref:glycosyltransferase family 4 protein n=1 Tax=Jannaschia formosa TaxID=2259592 RepID=UPI000E1BE21E|nr:glycosyltransferase family 4 protein [Jannaschia formosa]TFL17606.1 glycosyltransferase family 1 protein [Jannaschia formosa]
MHLAYVSTDPGIPVWGTKGASVHVQEMLRALARRGLRITVLSPRLEGTPPPDLVHVDAVALPAAPKGTPEDRARRLLAANADVEDALAALAPDLVYERHALYAHAAMEWAEARGVPSVLEINAPLLDEQAAHRTLVLREEAGASVARAMRAARLVSAVSEPVAAHARAMGACAAMVVPNAVDPARFPAPAPLAARPFTVGFLGSLKPWHGLSLLVAAFARLRAVRPEARLLIVGDGPERPAVEALLAELCCAEAATLTGMLAAREVPAALAQMDVGCAPYGASDAFYFSPLKIYEYMAAGLPVVTTRVGHLPDIVAHDRTGLIVPPGDPDALAGALRRLADAPDRGRALGAAGRDHVLRHHTWDGVAARVLARVAPARSAA